MLKTCSLAALLAVAVHLAYANPAPASEGTVSSGKLLSGSGPPPPPGTSLGGLYRSARDDYNARRHCSNCGPGYERDMRTYGRPGIVGYYSGMGSIDDDRNWYYRPEVLDDRMRGGAAGYQQSYAGGYRQPGYMMGYDYDRYMHRPDDRGGYGYGGYQGMGMHAGGYYDGGSSRMSHYPEMMRGYGYRGNGYDNLDPQYDYYMTQRGGGMSNRDRYYPGQGYYEDRGMSYGGQYDQKNFRPWDQTYRGISGFDNSGRGYYFASRPASPSAPSSSPTSSSSSSPPYTAHASYHVQAGAHPAPSSGYGSQASSGHEHTPAVRPGAPAAGGYRPEHHAHHGGPDRPDYQPPADSSDCCRNRYPSASSLVSHGSSHGYQSHAPTGPSSQHYGEAPSDRPHRPASSAGAGTWSYVSSGPHQTSHQASGSSSAGGGSYGEHGHHGGPGQYPGSGGSGGPSSHESYGGNRGSEHHRETDNRHQSPAYGGRPRPSAIGDTSYLMERDGSDSSRSESSSSSSLSSKPSASRPEPTGDADGAAARAKPETSPKSDESVSDAASAREADVDTPNIDRSA